MVKLTGEHRRLQLIDAADKLARKHGLYSDMLSLLNIAVVCKCSKSTVKYYWKGVGAIRAELITRSFETDRVLFDQALAQSDPVARNIMNDS